MKSFFRWMALLGIGLLCNSARAQAPLPPEIEDPECLGINKEPAHASLMPYANLKEALAAKRHSSTFARSLNGTWKFHWVSEPSLRPVDFFKPEFDVSGWDNIPVPSCWQLLGYGTPYYRNNGYTFKKDWPHVLSEPPKNWTAYNERDPVGSYRREFVVPADWNGREIFLTFDGVDSAFFLWINGQKVGFSMNSRNAAEFDVTKYVKPGTNMVAAEVYRYCAGSYIEDQDMWRLSGIFRNVTLWSAPQLHIRDFFVNSDLDAAYSNATLNVTAKIHNFSGQAVQSPKLDIHLYGPDGKEITLSGPVSGSWTSTTISSNNEAAVQVSIPVSNPAKWTAETPNLYTTVLTLDSDKGQEIISTRTGFRKIEIKDRVFMINGAPVKLKGANRHENWPDTGHYVSEERMIRDLEVLKQGNCNHVRTCHYSDDPRWYELCDEYGIYLVAEANVECHGYMNVLDREPKYRKAIVDRNVANVENFKNSASVVLWSLGNENGGGTNFRAALAAVKAIDPSRPVHYEPFGTGNRNPADVDSQMYTSPAEVERIAKNTNFTKPFYLCEYAHAMFNSMGAIGEYNDLFDKYPSLMGGAIWEWEDQGIWNRRNTNHNILAFGGGFGEVPNDHYFIHKGVVFSDRSPKPHYPEMKRAYQWIGIEPENLAAASVVIRNKYSFITLDKFIGRWTLSENGRQIEGGKFQLRGLAPGASKAISFGIKKMTPNPGSEYHLRVSFELAKDEKWAKAGYEIASAQYKLPMGVAAFAQDVSTMSEVKISQTDTNITVAGKHFSVVFDKETGTLSKLVADQTNILASGGGPRLHLWRAPHRDDDMWAARDWTSAGLNRLKFTVLSLTAWQPSPSVARVEAVVSAEGTERFMATHSALYTIYGDGSIAVDNTVLPQGRRIPLARMGVRLQLDKALNQFAFFGRGPMENYADRKRGFDVGQYTSSVRDQLTPYAKPMEAGNHEDVRWAALLGKDLPTLLAQPDGGVMQVSAVPYTDEVMAPVEYRVDLPASESTVLVLASRTLGVGSSACGPRPLDNYIVWSDPAAFSYALRLLPANGKRLQTATTTRVPQDRVKPVRVAPKDGTLELSCETKGAKLEYSTNATDWAPCAGAITNPPAGLISVRASVEGLLPYQGQVLLKAAGN